MSNICVWSSHFLGFSFMNVVILVLFLESPKSTENSRSPSPQPQQVRKRKLAAKLNNTETSTNTAIKAEPVKLSSRLGPPASNNSPEDTKSSVFKRLGEADCAPKATKKNVFDRLDSVKKVTIKILERKYLMW